MNSDIELFAKKLKMLRRKRKYTLEKLAELSNLTPNHIAKLEAAKSNPSFSSISFLAKALNVEIKDLFTFDDLRDDEFVREELEKIVRFADPGYVKLLYKIYKNIVN